MMGEGLGAGVVRGSERPEVEDAPVPAASETSSGITPTQPAPIKGGGSTVRPEMAVEQHG